MSVTRTARQYCTKARFRDPETKKISLQRSDPVSSLAKAEVILAASSNLPDLTDIWIEDREVGPWLDTRIGPAEAKRVATGSIKCPYCEETRFYYASDKQPSRSTTHYPDEGLKPVKLKTMSPAGCPECVRDIHHRQTYGSFPPGSLLKRDCSGKIYRQRGRWARG